YPKDVPLDSDSITINGSTKSTGIPHVSVTAQGTGVLNSGIGDKTGTVGNRHIKIQFSDSTTNFYCCIYYAAEFFRLRQLLLPQGDTGFIRSLSRSFQWDALGGKSGSLFMKTRDERFVVKELSTIEMKTFHEISQQYFDYLIGAALEQRLCVLSRILGIFHVGFKNSLSGEAHRFDVLVMENLFHDRTQLAFIYDLKGSLRKRLVDESSAFKNSSKPSNADLPVTGQLSENRHTVVARGGSNVVECNQLDSDGSKRPPVLLDQNLLNASVDSPLYLRVHSKNALSHCLQVDTDFLANLFLMDYSLLVGVDLSTNQLVIGLIDYLRKFTFDKRMEMMIKQTITSVQGPPPTILTPDLYRERFLVQMDNYFPLVPDQWYDSLAEHAEAWLIRASPTPIASAAQPLFQSQVNSAKNIEH
ncbi:1-phosphatidylinositol-4-phosphate 5-kinase, partial [Paragonimus heterotremus]